MFGFLKPHCEDAKYRQVYARCCQHLHRCCGTTALPFVSYESIFAYHLAVDARIVPALPASSPKCCRMGAPKWISKGADADVGRFTASFAMLLAGVKLEDDVRDDGRFVHRLARYAYARRSDRAKAYFASLDPMLPATFARCIEQHLEQERRRDRQSIEDYSAPTAAAFGSIYAALARLPSAEGVDANVLHEVGAAVGSALIAFDCAVDWRRDRWRGDFNPLPDETAKEDAFDWCRSRLLAASDLCRLTWGAESRSAWLLRSVAVRVAGIAQAPEPKLTWTQRFEQWGLIRQPGAVYARCDGCEAVGGCFECAGGCEGIGAACDGMSCCCDAAVCGNWNCGNNANAKKEDGSGGTSVPAAPEMH